MEMVLEAAMLTMPGVSAGVAANLMDVLLDNHSRLDFQNNPDDVEGFKSGFWKPHAHGHEFSTAIKKRHASSAWRGIGLPVVDRWDGRCR